MAIQSDIVHNRSRQEFNMDRKVNGKLSVCPRVNRIYATILTKVQSTSNILFINS